MELRLIALLAVLAGLTFSHGWAYHKGEESRQADWDAAVVKAKKEADEQTAALAESATLLRKARDAENERNAARLDAALVSLRNRPERLPEPARAACQGSSGTELSGRDSEFLVRLAGRADQLRTALSECTAWADAVTKGASAP